MTHIRRAWKNWEPSERTRSILSILILAAVVLNGLWFVSFTIHSNGQVRRLQENTVTIGFVARQQQRCVSWETQATLLRILLSGPNETPAQQANIRRLIKLPSLRVRMGDGSIVVLDCDKVIRQAVPGLPESLKGGRP